MTRRPSPVVLWLPVLTAWTICLGCGSARQFDQGRANQRLMETVDFLEYPVEIVAYGHAGDVDRGTEYWVFLDEETPAPPTPERGGGLDPEILTSRFPANAVFSFAASVGVAEETLGSPRQPDGELWEWASDDASIRLRTVPTERGHLTVVERLP